MNCTACGQPVPANKIYCSNCGAFQTPFEKREGPVATATRAKRGPWWAGLISGAGTIAVLLAGLLSGSFAGAGVLLLMLLGLSLAISELRRFFWTVTGTLVFFATLSCGVFGALCVCVYAIGHARF
jgi:ABC-type nickel/cobalt efflux system permease component RcnA